MEGSQIIIIAIVVILLLLLIVLFIRNTSEHNDAIKCAVHGLWTADSKFCTDSSIDGMMIYIGPDLEEVTHLSGGSTHKAYIIMYANNNVILQKTINIAFSSGGLSLIARNRHTVDVEITDIDEDSDSPITSIMPNTQTAVIDLINGKMTWTGLNEENELRVFADLYKDNQASSL